MKKSNHAFNWMSRLNSLKMNAKLFSIQEWNTLGSALTLWVIFSGRVSISLHLKTHFVMRLLFSIWTTNNVQVVSVSHNK